MSDNSPEQTPEEPLDEPTPALDDENSPSSQEDAAEAKAEDKLPAERAPRAGAPIRRKTAQAPVKKSAATRKRSEADVEHVDPYKAKNPAHFVRQSTDELKKVVWPTRSQLAKSFASVLIFVVFIIAFVGLFDTLFGWLLLKILGTN